MTQALLEETRFGYGSEDKGFHVGSKPWYAIGTELVDKAPSMEEGIKLAGLDWSVNLKELQTTDGNPTQFFGVMRSDNNQCLGAVTKNYTPLQNMEAFKFFEPFLESGQASLDCAGSFYNGRKVWVMAKINRDDMIIDDNTNDRVQKYILLSNSHDGGSAVSIGYTPYRISCNNSLTVALESNKSSLIRIYHRKNVVETVNSLQETMNLIDQTFITTEEKYKYLATLPVNKDDLQKYVKAVFSKQSLEQLYQNETGISEEELKNVRQSLISRVEEIFEMEYAKHGKSNAWTAYNSVNYYLNHDRARNQESAYNSLWFQSASNLDKRALKLAEKIR